MTDRYPIYKIEARWQHVLPDGRVNDGTVWYDMNRDPEEIKAEILEVWWPKYSSKFIDPSDFEFTVTLSHHELWCPGWFSHWTFDVGWSDEDYVSSFASYVDRMLQSELKGILMGADEMGRWCNHEGRQPPCRCETCTKQGVVRIEH